MFVLCLFLVFEPLVHHLSNSKTLKKELLKQSFHWYHPL
nr:MAG TPA: hypothetical protein [Caudoviricetes sp.]